MNSIVVFALVSVALQLAAGSACSQRAYLPKTLLGPKVYNQPIFGPGPIMPSPAPIVAAPPCAAPVLGQTIIDNSISRSLAETLQFLVVSDLLQSKLAPKAPLVTDIVAPVNTVVETISPGYPCSPYIDYVDYVSPYGTTYLDSYPYGITETIIAPEIILPAPCGSCMDPLLGSYLPSVYY